MKSHPSIFWTLDITLLLMTLLAWPTAATLGGEKVFFTAPQMTPGINHRQNVCARFDAFRNGTVLLKDALEGLKLHVAVAAYEGSYFRYDPETGIDRQYPGLVANIMDELARRGKFTWRESFAVTGDPADTNSTWQELLLWSIETYDLHIEWWAQNLARMNLGVSFLKEWYDASIILISKEIPEEVSDEINWWNWTRPYEASVWIVTIITILASGVVYQILEWYADVRNERTMWEWWQENAYMSFINFTQAYEYQPTTFASRMFGVSMAVWALVMTATYTANLASLLVDRKPAPVIAQNLDEAVVFGNRICTWEGTWSDDHVKANHPTAIRIPKKTVLELYNGLHDGDCDYAVEAVASWKKNKALKEFNPFCDLYWVGGDRKVSEIYASFVSKVDTGEKCTGFIRDVMNLHIHDMIDDGFLADAWDREYQRTQDINCDTYRPEMALAVEEQLSGENAIEDGTRRRELLRYGQSALDRSNRQRRLKGAGAKGAAGGAVAAAAAAGGGSTDAQKLTLEQMIGTFALHWFIMLLSVVVANIRALYLRYNKTQVKECESGNPSGLTTQTSELIDAGDKSSVVATEPMTLEKAPERDVLAQFNNMRQSQIQMQTSQSQMEQFQIQMQQTQFEMLKEQRKLQEQIEKLLRAQALIATRESEA